MFAETTSAAMVGAEPRPVRVEAHVGQAKEAFKLTGLPDTAVREAKERVRAAVASSSLKFPNRRITVNLAPADLPKAGSDYDLPIALCVLGAAGSIPTLRLVASGELALDGSVRRGRSTLGAAILAAKLGVPCLVADDAAPEAKSVMGAQVWPVRSLSEAVALASGGQPRPVEGALPRRTETSGDLSEVRGHALARRALEVSAAGGHHLFMYGPPGSGKTMLAKRIAGVLPAMSQEDALTAACVWAAAARPRGVDFEPPFRAPHHTASLAALIGGGTGTIVPGELSLANGGVLFLDELGEFSVRSLDSLRQPLEEGTVSLARRGTSVTFPADVLLVAASNPCPCGFTGDRLQSCHCLPAAVARYRRRISGPLLDRFDIRVPVRRLNADELDAPPGEASAVVRERVGRARATQDARGKLNRNMGRSELDELPTEGAGSELLRGAVERAGLTARGFDRVRRVSRTLADLEGVDVVAERHVAEALTLRGSW